MTGTKLVNDIRQEALAAREREAGKAMTFAERLSEVLDTIERLDEAVEALDAIQPRSGRKRKKRKPPVPGMAERNLAELDSALRSNGGSEFKPGGLSPELVDRLRRQAKAVS